MTRGLTLIELVVAMAVFALVAVMGLQSLSGSLRMRDSLTLRADQTSALGQATALLRNDLSAVAPMLFFPPEKGRPRSALRAASDGQGFAMSVIGQPALTGPAGAADAASWQRAEWRIDTTTARLMRRSWPTLYPVSANQQVPEVAVLDGVRALGLRSYWAGRGWVAGLQMPREAGTAPDETSRDGDRVGAARETYSSALPYAVEVTLETQAYGRIVLVEYLQ